MAHPDSAVIPEDLAEGQMGWKRLGAHRTKGLNLQQPVERRLIHVRREWLVPTLWFFDLPQNKIQAATFVWLW
jgi:hypothetical protein